MRLIDADALLERMKKTNRYFDVKFDIDAQPAVAAVPVSALRILRDDLYENGLISMEGLRQLNALIAMHEGGGANG